MEQIKRKMTALREERDHAIEERDAFEAERNDGRTKLDQADLDVQDLMRKVKMLENDLDTAEDRYCDANDKAKSLEGECEDLTRQNKQYARKMDLLEEAESDSKLDALRSKVRVFEDDNEELMRKNKVLQRQIDMLEDDLEKVENLYDKAKTELVTTLNELEDM